ncbi:MAG: hypothetical protein WDM85_18950 [Caulobacteraceae bacterium]
MSIAIVGICIPSFVTAPLLQLVLGSQLGWLPIGSWGRRGLAQPGHAGDRAGRCRRSPSSRA